MSQDKRESQASKVTSTPQKGIPEFPSLSLSSIGSDSLLPTELHTNTQFPPRTPSTLSLIENVDSLDITKKRNIKKSGKFWQNFKPMRNETLYGLICLSPLESQYVTELLLKYEVNPKFVIMSILELCTDVAGFQHFDINKIYDYENCDAKGTIYFLNNQNLDAKVLYSGNYLMQAGQNHDMVFIQESLYRFFQKLILVAHKMNILYDDLFAVHIFEFIRCMAFSILKPLRHAGILFSLKIMTGCSSAYHDVSSLYMKSTREFIFNRQTFEDLKYKKNKLLKYLDFFYLIFRKNCLIPDRQSHHVRAECAKEIRHWMDNIPEYILNANNCLDLLRKLMLDESHNVRLNALQTCEHLINLEIQPDGLTEILHPLIETIGGRLYDINYTVAARACEVFIRVLDKFPRLVEADRFKSILQLIYHENYDLATTAAKFVMSYIRTICRNEKDILMKIAKISETGPLKDRTNIMIESMLMCTPELSRWDTFLQLMLSEDLSLTPKKCLLNMFHISVEQLLTDISLRNRHKTITNNSLQNRAIINKSLLTELLPKTAALLKTFREDSECQIYIFKTICRLDLTTVKSTFNVCCSEIIKLIENIIMQSDKSDLIEQGVKTIAYFCNHLPDFNRRASSMAKSIAQHLVDDFREYVQRESLSSSPEDMRSLYNVTLRLSMYFALFDLTAIISWTDLFDYLDFEISETAENCIVCAKHHLIWSMRNIIEKIESKTEPNYELQLRNLRISCKDYLTICFDILKRNRASSLELTAFSSICDLAYAYHADLEGPIKFNSAIISLKIKLDDETEYAGTLLTYFESHLIENENLTSLERKTHLVKVIELLLAELLPAKFFTNLLSLYCKDYEDYSDILDSVVKQLQEINIFAAAVISTLIGSYSKLLSKYKALNVNGGEFQNLKALARKMSAIKTKETYTIVNFGMNHALRDRMNHEFLYLLKYFALRLKLSDKQIILKKFQQKVSKEDMGRQVILYFSHVLRTSLGTQKLALNKERTEQDKTEEVKIIPNGGSDSSQSRSKYSLQDSSSDDLHISDASDS